MRFIPAGAGNASNRKQLANIRPVHPRGCGERNPTRLELQQSAGSSPRVRGTRIRHKPMTGRTLVHAPCHDGIAAKFRALSVKHLTD